MKLNKIFNSVTSAIVLATSISSSFAGQLHIFTSDASGFNTHSVWYDDGQEVTVVDTQFTSDIAKKMIAQIKQQTQSPITRVIVTHPSPDKFNALSVFHQLGAKSIASVKTAEAISGVDAYKRFYWTKIAKTFTDSTYPKIESIQETFAGEQKIFLKSGETLTLIELKKPGVATNQIVVRIDASGDLIVGDLVAYKAHAWLEGGIIQGQPTPTLTGWKEDLKQLLTLGRGKVYGGRGQFASVTEVVPAEIAYLDKADAIVSAYVKRLGVNAREELTNSTKSQKHFKMIQAEFIKAFPHYAFPDLIGYGVYGLALSKLP